MPCAFSSDEDAARGVDSRRDAFGPFHTSLLVGGVALVLGGGGLVGHAWHVGALAGLADATGWDAGRAELVVGTSAGAVVGAELRAGLHPLDLLRPGVGAAPVEVPRPQRGPRSWRPAAPAMAVRALRSRAPSGLALAGLLPRGRHDAAIVRDAIARLHPPECPWPPGLWVTAVRLVDGRRVVFGRAAATGAIDVATAVAASCAMAGFFGPVPVAGDDHVDGGSRSASNADLVAGGGFDLVVVSSPMSLHDTAPAWPRQRGAALARRHRLVHHRRLVAELAQVSGRGGRPLVATFEPGPAQVSAMGSIASSMDFGRRAAVADAARRLAAGHLRSGQMAPARVLLEASARQG